MYAERLSDTPIVHSRLDESIGGNINGPSLIRVPDWVQGRLGKYYLYFAHHNGQFIRLAYSDALCGPWRIFQRGVLPLNKSHFAGHIASPDVHVDHEHKRIIMYYHGSDTETDATTPQHTRVAWSDDGLSFQAHDEILGGSYWRAFQYGGATYALVMPGVFYRCDSSSPVFGVDAFSKGPTLFTPDMRHSAVCVVNNALHVFYSNVGDCPESILHTTIDISGHWLDWRAGNTRIVLSPVTEAEGVNAPRVPSLRGMADKPLYELRDPAFFEDEGRCYLLYCVAGEQGIGIAQLHDFTSPATYN